MWKERNDDQKGKNDAAQKFRNSSSTKREREKGGRNAKNSRVINIDEFIFSGEKQTTDNKIRLSAERQKKKNKRKGERKKGKSHKYIFKTKEISDARDVQLNVTRVRRFFRERETP